AFFLTIIITYMVLASQFESFIHPFTIMLALPLSIVGALGSLFLTANSINVMSLIGMLMLIGLVVKNSILLVDYTNTLRERGLEMRCPLPWVWEPVVSPEHLWQLPLREE
ncbi:MAG: efflux RND transporter permease subunit, partial [Deltaproteobacteria bacterium]|nr:efflux RND transporter permease subunit [Deltaproteobacteria bacterium]